MAIPIHLTLIDNNGRKIKGSVDYLGREGTIEVLEYLHDVDLPVDDYTGKISANRLHYPVAFEKEVDRSSVYLYQALTSGKRLQSAIFDFYRINDHGFEEKYFTTTLQHVYVASLNALMPDIKAPDAIKYNHSEYVELAYQQISWCYCDGNIQHADSWNKR